VPSTRLSTRELKVRFAREARLGSRLGKVQGFVRAFEWGRRAPLRRKDD
jgi:hypothetical protein